MKELNPDLNYTVVMCGPPIMIKFTLGGLKGANPAKGVAADDTLEARLEAQHDWFLENAGLEINI